MGSAYFPFPFLGFVLLHLLQTSPIAISNFLSPLVSPIFDDVCRAVECGKGNCRPSRNSSFSFVCECERGWKQARPDDDDGLRFLPCVIPNCTVNFSCLDASPPAVLDKQNKDNTSIFDPCHWAICGGGMCNKTSTFTHICDCQPGFYNLLNVTAFPCFRDCALGMDCSGLGISAMNKSAPPPTSSLSGNNGNRVSTSLQYTFTRWMIAVFSFASIRWK